MASAAGPTAASRRASAPSWISQYIAASARPPFNGRPVWPRVVRVIMPMINPAIEPTVSA